MHHLLIHVIEHAHEADDDDDDLSDLEIEEMESDDDESDGEIDIRGLVGKGKTKGSTDSPPSKKQRKA